jgi:hypothetical protein
MNEQWYLPSPNDNNLGPFTTDAVVKRLISGEIQSDTLCWRAGMEDWLPVSGIEEIDTAWRAARAARRARAIRMVVPVIMVCAIAAGGWIGYQIWRGPVELREGRALFEQGRYEETAHRLSPLVEQPNPRADVRCLMGAATLYHLMQTDDSARVRWGRQGQPSPMQGALSLLASAATEERLKPEIDRILREAVTVAHPKASDAVERIVALYETRKSLGVADSATIVGDFWTALNALPADTRRRGLQPEMLRHCLQTDPSRADDLLRWMTGDDMRDRRAFSTAVARILNAAGDRPETKRALAREALAQARRMAAGDPRGCEEALTAAKALDPSLESEADKARIEMLRVQLNQGKAAEVADTLVRGAGQTKGLEQELAAVAIEAAQALRDSDRKRATAALAVAFQADPKLAAREDMVWTALQMTETPDDNKLARSQAFLNDFPESAHRTAALRMIVRDARTRFDQVGAYRHAQAAPYVEAGRRASLVLLGCDDVPADVDQDVYRLAEAVVALAGRDAKAGQSARRSAIDLCQRLLNVMPRAPRAIEISQAIEGWRRDAGRGTLAPSLDDLADRVDKELRIVLVAAPGAVRVLVEHPDDVDVVSVPFDCTKEKFSSEELDILAAWVSRGGILWAVNNVLDHFGIKYAWGRTALWVGWKSRYLCGPGIMANISPVVAGCNQAEVNLRRFPAANLDAPGVVPLLTSGDVAVWSIAPYGRGWVSDVKDVDVNKYDGARFWLNFRLWCMGEPIPGIEDMAGDVRRRPPPNREATDISEPAKPLRDAAVRDICRQLSTQPRSREHLQALDRALTELGDHERRPAYLLVHALGSLIVGDRDAARKSAGELRERYAQTQYARDTEPDRLREICPNCKGAKSLPPPVCQTCGGNGHITCRACGGSGRRRLELSGGTGPCVTCKGTGRQTCPTCQGRQPQAQMCQQCGGKGNMFSAVLLQDLYLKRLIETAEDR